jgi:hypothetical protein
VKTVVSRETILVGGKPACTRCGREPRRPGQRWGRECHAAWMRERRAGKVEVLLTPEEWAGVVQGRQLRAAAAAGGRHRR